MAFYSKKIFPAIIIVVEIKKIEKIKEGLK